MNEKSDHQRCGEPSVAAAAEQELARAFRGEPMDADEERRAKASADAGEKGQEGCVYRGIAHGLRAYAD